MKFPQMAEVSDKYTATVLRGRYTNYRNSAFNVIQIIQETGLPIRAENPPEDITENIVKFIIQTKLGDPSCKWAKAIGKIGDLFSDIEGVQEVKAFTSDGPCSFGPDK